MEDVTGISDDMVIAGRDEMEHGRNFLAFMEKCMSNSLTLNLEKIQFKQSQVSFYGHCWSKHGISPDPKKIQACNHMEFPPDKESMRSFLGMINYFNRYSALNAHLVASLSALTHQAADYKPAKVHFENFNQLKQPRVVSALTSKYGSAFMLEISSFSLVETPYDCMPEFSLDLVKFHVLTSSGHRKIPGTA